MSENVSKIRQQVAGLRELMKLEADASAPPQEVMDIIRRVGDRLFYMGKDKADAIVGTLRKALEDLDQAVGQAGGPDSEWGRRVMNLVRKLDGFEVNTTLELRSVVDGFTRPSSLQFVSSLPKFPEKQVESLMEDLYDLADEMGGEDE